MGYLCRMDGGWEGYNANIGACIIRQSGLEDTYIKLGSDRFKMTKPRECVFV